MTSPTERREKKIEAATKARAHLNDIGPTKLEVRATVLYDRVSESVKTICASNSNNSKFSAAQTETLIDIAVHLALLFDNDMQPPTTFWGRFKSELKQASIMARLAAIPLVITVTIGMITISKEAYKFFGYDSQTNASSAQVLQEDRTPDGELTKK